MANIKEDLLNYGRVRAGVNPPLPKNYPVVDVDKCHNDGDELFDGVIGGNSTVTREMMDYLVSGQLPQWYDAKSDDRCKNVGDELFDSILGKNIPPGDNYTASSSTDFASFMRMNPVKLPFVAEKKKDSRAAKAASFADEVEALTRIMSAPPPAVKGSPAPVIIAKPPAVYNPLARVRAAIRARKENVEEAQRENERREYERREREARERKERELEEERRRNQEQTIYAPPTDTIANRLHFDNPDMEFKTLFIMNRRLYWITRDSKYLTSDPTQLRGNVADYLAGYGFKAAPHKLFEAYIEYKNKFPNRQLIHLSDLENIHAAYVALL